MTHACCTYPSSAGKRSGHLIPDRGHTGANCSESHSRPVLPTNWWAGCSPWWFGAEDKRRHQGLTNTENVLHSFLATLSRVHSHDTKDALDRLDTPECQNDEAIDIIQRFVDPLDCRLLYQIVSALKDEQLTKAWDEYCQRSKEACRTTLEQCRKLAIRPHRLSPSGITLGMQTKISPPDITIQKIVQLKEFLVSKVGLKESVFQGFASSAVALFFTVDRKWLPLLIRLLSRHQKALVDFSITTVFVPGEFFYDVAKDQEYPCPKVCVYMCRAIRTVTFVFLFDVHFTMISVHSSVEASAVLIRLTVTCKLGCTSM